MLMTRSRFITIDEANLQGKRVLLRVDFNVPIKDGKVADDSRIRATIPTIQYLHDAGAAVAILSHLGSPRPAIYDSDYSLEPVANYLTEKMGIEVPLVIEWLDDLQAGPGQVVMLENIRFASGEKTNTDALARKMATLCDVYVNEAFASARREQSSVHGIAKYLQVAYTGPLFVREVEALEHVVHDVQQPLVTIMGGMRRPETKLDLLEAQVGRSRSILLGGVIGNTFLKAANRDVGKSVYFPELIDKAEEILQKAENSETEIVLPMDVCCGSTMDEEAECSVRRLDEIEADDMILDIGPQTLQQFTELVSSARTLLWTGPLGVAELEKFSSGSREIARAIASSEAYSIANGGDTLALIESLNIQDDYSHLSTGGGSSLEFMQGKQLPAVSMMEESARVRYAMEREY